MHRALVTGALGNVGREVAAACAERGLAVRVADLDPVALAARFPQAPAARLDFVDRSTWAPALQGCDAVFLLRPPPLADMRSTLCPFVDAAFAAGVEHVVFLSVSGADRMKWVPHGEVERHLAATGRAFTVLRPGFFAQNFQDAYRRDIVEDGRVFVPAGAGRVAFIDARDIGAVAARVLEQPERFRGQTLTLTGPRAITFDEAAATLSEVIGARVRYEPATIPAYAYHLLRRRRMPAMQVAIQTVLHAGLRRGDAEEVEPTVERILGRRARTFAEYARDGASIWRPPAR